MRIHPLIMMPAVAALALLSACGEDKGTDPPVTEGSSFKTMQTKLFDKSCATSGCHAGTTPAGALSLESGVAYANLINISPNNPVALADGLKRVVPGSPEQSFLYKKLSGDLRAGHGERMPMGSSALSDNALQFVREWIAAGAPQTGVVSDSSLLDAVTSTFIPPPPPAKGVQIRMKPFDIGPKSEREVFYYMQSPNTSLIFVNKFQVKMRDNSHHFIMYAYPPNTPASPPAGIFRDQGGDMEIYAAYRQFFLGSQVADFTFEFPEGVALALPPRAGLDMNSHYVNPGTTPMQGEVYVNLHTTDNVQRIAKDLLWGDDSFVLLPYRTTIVDGTIPTDEDVDIFMLTSHTHKRGKSFKIYVDGGPRHGELIYQSSDWHLPTVQNFSPPLRLSKGEGLRYEAEYYNETEFPIRFGLTSDDEMCIIAGYYAPVL